MKTAISLTALLVIFCLFVNAQLPPSAPVSALSGRWTLAAYGGGIASLPLAPINYSAHLSFYPVGYPDTLYCDVYHDSTLTFSGPVTVAIDSLDSLHFTIQPDLMGYLSGSTTNTGNDLDIIVSSHDSMTFSHPAIADDFYHVLVKSCCDLSVKSGTVDLYGGPLALNHNHIGYHFNAILKHGWGCGGNGGYNGGLTIAVFDSTGCTNWVSKFSDVGIDPVSGYQYNQVYGNIHCRDRNLQAFDFLVFDPNSLPSKSTIYQQRVVNFINSVPDGDFILVYSVNTGWYTGWSQSLVDVFTDLGSQELLDTFSSTALRNSNTLPWLLFAQKGNPQTALEQAGASINDSVVLNTSYNCVDVIIDTTTVINNNQDNANIEIYPNPATDVIQLKCKTPMQRITIINSLGQAVQEITPSTREMVIRLENLRKGIYLLRIKIEEGVVTRKFIKN